MHQSGDPVCASEPRARCEVVSRTSRSASGTLCRVQNISWTVIADDDRDLDPAVLEDAGDLCHLAFGPGFTSHDWAHTFGGQRLVVTDRSRVLGHTAVVPRSIRIGNQLLRVGYVEGVAVAPSLQGQGIGTLLMRATNDVVRLRYDVGVLSTGRHAFYERLGWERWEGPSYVQNGSRLARTPDEDAGIMVLRTPLTPCIDLRSEITCQAREGDDW